MPDESTPVTAAAPSAPAPVAATAAVAVPRHSEAAIKHAGELILGALPHVGEVAQIAVQAGVHMSPQATMIATFLQLLAALHAPKPAAN